MIRAWLASRRHRAAHRGERAGDAPAVDPAIFLGAQFDVRDAQIEGLRDALAEAQKDLAEERAARAQEVAHLQYALAQAVQLAGLERNLRVGAAQARNRAEIARRIAEEPTVPARAMGRAAPTHHVPQPAPGWRGAQTERRPR